MRKYINQLKALISEAGWMCENLEYLADLIYDLPFIEDDELYCDAFGIQFLERTLLKMIKRLKALVEKGEGYEKTKDEEKS